MSTWVDGTTGDRLASLLEFIVEEAVNPMNPTYGAVGDLSVDDSAAITAALNAVAAAGGGTLFLPVGRFKLSSTVTIPAGVRIVGAGGLSYNEGAPTYIGSCFVAGVAGMTMLQMDTGSLNQNGFDMVNVNLIDPVGGGTTLLRVDDTNHWSLKRVAFSGHADLSTIGLSVTATPASGDNSWNYMEDCHTRRAAWNFLSGFGVTIFGGSQIGNIVNCIDVGPTYSLFRMVGFKGENGNPSLRIRGYECYVDGYQWEVSGSTVNAKALTVDSDGTSISGKKIYLGALALGGGGGAGHFGLEITAATTDVEVVGLSTANFTSGQGDSLVSTAATNLMMLRTDQALAKPFLRMGTVTFTRGTGSPEGVITASLGSMFYRTDGGVSSTVYFKSSGTGNTGWTAISPGGNAAWGETNVAESGGAAVSIDATATSIVSITVADTTAFTINAPTNATSGQQLAVEIFNNSGGTLGNITWTGGATGWVTTFTNATDKPIANARTMMAFVYRNGRGWTETAKRVSF